jgi:hypothetical protein
MQELQGNIWDWFDSFALVVPTNGIVKANGEAVMGAGLAKQTALRYPYLPKQLGHFINEFGNHVHPISDTPLIFSFPTKNHYKDDSDLELIERSANELVVKTKFTDKKILIPRVGCGLGKLKWSDVKPVLESILVDDKFIIINQPND